MWLHNTAALQIFRCNGSLDYGMVPRKLMFWTKADAKRRNVIRIFYGFFVAKFNMSLDIFFINLINDYWFVPLGFASLMTLVYLVDELGFVFAIFWANWFILWYTAINTRAHISCLILNCFITYYHQRPKSQMSFLYDVRIGERYVDGING